MKILAVTNQSPFPVNNGQRVRTSLFLEALKNEHEIDLAIYDYQKEKLPNWFNKTFLFSSDQASKLNDFIALLKGKSAYVNRFKNDSAFSAMKSLLKDHEYDLIISLALPGMVNLPDNISTPIWLDDHNIEYEIYREYGKSSNILMKYGALLESRRLKKWELAMIQKAQKVSLCSDEDVKKLSEKFRSKCLVIPNSCPDSGEKTQAKFSKDSPTIIYSGTMGWKPNVDACLYFIEQIWPTIKSAIPAAKFVIVGKGPAQKLLDIADRDDDISCTGFVESTDSYHSGSNVSVVPLRMGSGTRIKIIEAAQFGLPVVSTSKGAEGLHFVNNEEIYINDNPEDFARSVISLLTNREIWNDFSGAISKRFEQEYSRSSIISDIEKRIETFLTEGGEDE